MSRLVIDDRRKDWRICVVCRHKINPVAKICEETHLPCSHSGCIPQNDAPE